MKRIIAISAVALVLVGCDSMGPKQTAGTLIGAGGGALIGSQFGRGALGPVLGAVGGAALGSYVGHQMDKPDKPQSRY